MCMRRSFFYPLIAALLLVLIACGTATSPQIQEAAVPAQAPVSSTDSISSSDAISHVGDRATVCGTVVDSRYATGSKGKPTFLNFDRAYPNHLFTVVIWGSERGNFPKNPERHYLNKRVCAAGLIETFRGKAQIIARNASQLQVSP